MNSSGFFPSEAEFARRRMRWSKLGTRKSGEKLISLVSCRQGWGSLKTNHSISDGAMTLGGRTYTSGLGTHADSEIVFACATEVKRFQAVAGIDENPDTVNAACKLRFSVQAGKRVLWKSAPVRCGEPVVIDIAIDSECRQLTLSVVADSLYLAHVNWCDAKITTAAGTVVMLSEALADPVCDLLPLSFCYGGKPGDELLPLWQWEERQEKHNGMQRRIISAVNPVDQFTVICTLDEYDALPVSIWHVTFANRGNKPSQPLNSVRSIDLMLPRSEVRYARGSFNYSAGAADGSAYRDNFKLEQMPAEAEEPLLLKGEAGRSSSEYMPYLNTVSADGGVLLAVGWTGQWMAEIVPCYPQCTRIAAGMEFLDTYLEPGEEISQPSALLIDYDGDDFERGQNLLRRFFATIWIPEKMRQPPVSFNTWGSVPQKMHLERNAILDKHDLDYDCYWIDAGWFGRFGEDGVEDFSTSWIMNTGNWQVNPAVYPDGLRAVADAVHASGRKFLVWFEPERGWNGSDMVLKHPEYFYDFELGGNKILNLGNPEAEKWMYGMISGMMDEQGIDYYRQDFNTAPLGAWRRNDKPGRTGISEIRHIEALYRIWDRLIGRYPDILIDNCASGGRRLDFEMMHRSVPLWASDFQCHQFFDSETAQSLVAGINAWLPCFGFGTQYRPGDTYNFRSLLGPGMAFELFMYENSPVSDDYPYDWHRKMLAEYRRAREFLSGDYYELTAQTRDKCQWHVLQFDRPDRNGGCIIAMRRSNSPFKVSEFVLRGIDPNASYVFEDTDKETSQTLSGAELVENGLEIELPERRSSALLFYHKKQA